MELIETDERGARNPWERARAGAVAALLGKNLREGVKVLGVGDGHLCRSVFGGLADKEVEAVEEGLGEEGLRRLKPEAGITYLSELPPARNRYDLTLLLDVLERVEDDRRYLRQIVRQHVAAGGLVLVTVPAFQVLYGGDDWFQGSYRRYRLSQVEQLAGSAGLTVLSSGYLFGSLLIPRFLRHRLLSWGKVRKSATWKGGAFLGTILGRLIELESVLMMWLAKGGITLPGVTAWALCENDSTTH